jgi:two-component system OmpR family response regulator
MRFSSDPAAQQLDRGNQKSETGHLLVVDDDEEICGLIAEYFSGEGYRISIAGDGVAMRRIMAQAPIDLVLLDLGLPGEGGLELAQWIRAHSEARIIVLSGRGDTIDRIIALELGVDDYLSKPFAMRELLARVRSVLRRVQVRAEVQTRPGRARVRFAGWTLDRRSRSLWAPTGDEVRLTAGEFDLLAAFIDNANSVLSRDRLLDITRDRDAGPIDRTIDVQVGRLRRKLHDTSSAPRLIKSVRGAGYIFTPIVEPAELPAP